eukprot:Awhi_evm1s339
MEGYVKITNPNAGFDRGFLTHFFHIVSVNSLNTRDGSSSFLKGSKAAHSCAPNIKYSREKSGRFGDVYKKMQ